MPVVTLQFDKENNKYFAIRCGCRHHVVKHGGKVTEKSKCSYVLAAEGAYKLP